MKIRAQGSVFFAIIFILAMQSLYSQDYLITFSGSGQSTMVETVEVKNINQHATLTLNGTDTLHLFNNVGVSYLLSVHAGMKLYPNPTNQNSRIEFNNSRKGNTSIEIYGFSGRLVFEKTIQLDAGIHAFTISGLNAGLYLVKVRTLVQIYSNRLVSLSGRNLMPELHYEGAILSQQNERELKSISNIVAMQYNDGERLVFKGISGDYAHTKSLVPTESQNIDFEFMDCIDFDGNHYGVATIGEQIWMTENLRTTRYVNGIAIPNVTGANAWSNLLTGAYVCYDNNILWKSKYGFLYNWYATVDANGLCPTGWHVPSNDEWTVLTDYVGGTSPPHGNELKSCRQVNSPLGGSCNTSEHPRWDEDTYYWNYGTDNYGFSGLPGGHRYSNGSFFNLSYGGYWWSTTEYSSNIAWFRSL